MTEPANDTGPLKHFSWLVFGVVPTILLAVCIVLAAIATIVLDHVILGRDAEGWPVLYKTPLLRHAVEIFHLEIVYALPAVLAVAFLTWGRRAGAGRFWVLLGGVLVCAFGSVHVIEAAWTGVKGTSQLSIGLVESAGVAAARLAANLAIYAAAVAVLRR